MTNEEARLQRALRDAETDRDNERRRAEVAESKVREAEGRVRNLEDQLVAQTERADEMQEELDRRVAAAPSPLTEPQRDAFYAWGSRIIGTGSVGVRALAVFVGEALMQAFRGDLPDDVRITRAPAPRPMSAEEQRAYAEGYSPPKPAAQETPRERAPAVWAAAFADFHGRSLAAAYSAADGSPAERMATAIASVDGAACARVADAAVMTAHGEEAPAAEPIERASYTHEEVEAAFRRYLNERGHRKPTQEDADNSWSLFEGWLPR